MSDQPTIADRKPIKASLKAGEKYLYCTCGNSANQPFCDGAHAGSSFKPKMFTVEEDKEGFLCQCKHTGNAPFCDGTHARLPSSTKSAENQISKPRSGQVRNTHEEDMLEEINELASNGLSNSGHHGPMDAMGVPRPELPMWKDLQILVAQLANRPLPEDADVGTELIVGPNAKKPLKLNIPLFVSDMSFGALSEEAKTAMARGANRAGTGICSGEGGMLPEEQKENDRYFYELASAKFGYDESLLKKVQAFHFKGGQGAKTGTGGHLPAEKVTPKIASVRGLPEGEAAVSPPSFEDLKTSEDFKKFGDRVREVTGGIPIGMKMSANHIEDDIDFALEAGVDYIIVDGRGGGTGAAPLIFRNNISVPTIPALARARRHLDKKGRSDVTLIATGGLRVADDFIKALALGADGVAVANSAMQAIGCIGARMCHTNNCPAGIATQNPELRKKLDVDSAAKRLEKYFVSTVSLMKVMARACGHDHINQFELKDITTWKREMADLSGVRFAGVGPTPQQ